MTTEFKLASYRPAAGRPRGAIIHDERVYDIAKLLGSEAPTSIVELLEEWDGARAAIPDALGRADPASAQSLAQTELLAPLLYPGAVYIAGANYSDHVREMSGGGHSRGLTAPWHVLKTSRAAIVGPDARISLPPDTKMGDWEVELAVVIGRKAKDVTTGEALAYVAGYTVANDVSARDIGRRQDAAEGTFFKMDWIAHKCFDGSCPLGPWIVPAEQFPDPQSVALKLWLNGELKQDSNTSNMIFGVAEQISAISRRVTLYPGDVILTGTPAGTGSKYSRYLVAGDVMKAEVEGIGSLVTHVV